MKHWPKRLALLERVLVPAPGCDRCRGWTRVILVGEDGAHRPPCCSDCGRCVPTTLEVHVIGVRIADL